MKIHRTLLLTCLLVLMVNFTYAAMLGTSEILILVIVAALLLIPVGLIIWLVIYLIRKNRRSMS